MKLSAITSKTPAHCLYFRRSFVPDGDFLYNKHLQQPIITSILKHHASFFPSKYDIVIFIATTFFISANYSNDGFLSAQSVWQHTSINADFYFLTTDHFTYKKVYFFSIIRWYNVRADLFFGFCRKYTKANAQGTRTENAYTCLGRYDLEHFSLEKTKML